MTPDEVVALLGDIETDRVERKRSLSDEDRVREAICAFANDLPAHGAPGVVAIGVEDDGRPSNVPIDDAVLLRLAHFRDDGTVYPFPSMTVDRVRFEGADVAVAVVEPSTTPPVQFRGRTWIRVGPRRAIATPEEELRLIERRRSAAVPFDSRPLTGATLDDLDVERFEEELLPQLVAADILAANERPLDHQLAGLRFTDRHGVPTAAGILFAGVEPTAWLPGAEILFLRFDGLDLDAPVRSSHRLSGTLPAVIDEVEEVARSNVETSTRFADVAREERKVSLPFDAFSQVVRNAVMHRTYEGTNAPVRVSWFDDRVEILSPGGPFGQVTTTNFGEPTVVDYRNPTVAGVLGQLGYVQRFGAGIQLARRVMAANGNTGPTFEATPTAVNVRLELLR